MCWPTHKTWYIEMMNGQEGFRTYEELYADFYLAKELIYDLTGDIGYADRCFLFDDENNFNKAKQLLTEVGIEFLTRSEN